MKTRAPLVGVFGLAGGLYVIATLFIYRGAAASLAVSSLGRGPWTRWLGPPSSRLVKSAQGEIRAALQQVEAPMTDVQHGMASYELRIQVASDIMRRAVLADLPSGSALLGLAAAECELDQLRPDPDPERCRTLLDLSEAREPLNSEYQLQTAEMDLRAGLATRGEGVAARVVTRDPKCAPAAVRLLLEYGYEPSRAVEILEGLPEVVVATRDAFLERGRAEDYLTIIERSTAPRTRPLLESYGEVAFKLKQFERVVAQMRKIGAAANADLEATRLGLVATSTLALGDHDEAARQTRAALALRPEDPLLRELLGDCELAGMRWEESVQCYRASLGDVARTNASRGQMARLYRKIGDALAGRGDGAAAFESYQQSLGLAPADEITQARMRAITHAPVRRLGT